MNAIYLRFPDKATADDVLGALSGPLDRDDVGPIDPDPSYHVNVLYGDSPGPTLELYVVVPTAPRRRFAGY